MPARKLRGKPVAAPIRTDVADRVAALDAAGTAPTLATVLASDDGDAERFLELKHEACADVGIETRDRRVSPTAPRGAVADAVASICEDPDVDAVFVQAPLPDHADDGAVRRNVDPTRDVDCFHPENLGRLVDGDPRFVPATTAAVSRLLSHYNVTVTGRDVVVVGRSSTIGTPLANRLLHDDEPGNATVTVCHSRTTDLASVTRRADVLVTACGVPALVDGSMLSTGVVVVDVSANRQRADGETFVVGDVEVSSAGRKASAITPVPGGVGPVTIASLLENVVIAAERRVRDGDWHRR